MPNDLNVLLLDDIETLHDITKSYLKDVYEIYSAYTYDEAVELIKTKGINFFHIFICDLYLQDKEKSGLSFILKYLEGCKVIVVSGFLTKEIIDILIDHGVYAALRKPVHIDSLFVSMNSIIRCNKVII